MVTQQWLSLLALKPLTPQHHLRSGRFSCSQSCFFEVDRARGPWDHWAFVENAEKRKTSYLHDRSSMQWYTELVCALTRATWAGAPYYTVKNLKIQAICACADQARGEMLVGLWSHGADFHSRCLFHCTVTVDTRFLSAEARERRQLWCDNGLLRPKLGDWCGRRQSLDSSLVIRGPVHDAVLVCVALHCKSVCGRCAGVVVAFEELLMWKYTSLCVFATFMSVEHSVYGSSPYFCVIRSTQLQFLKYFRVFQTGKA